MENKNDLSKIREETRNLRKKVKELEVSRALIKSKSREKGKQIKAYQERQVELVENRDKWKSKYKAQQIDHEKLAEKYKEVAALFEMKEEELKEILVEFEELKKKIPPQK